MTRGRAWRRGRTGAMSIAGTVLLVAIGAAPGPGAAPSESGGSPDEPAESPSANGLGEGERLFAYEVRPLLAARCFSCHGPDPSTRRATLRLDRRREAIGPRPFAGDPPAVVPGDPDGSLLIQRVTEPEAEYRMPPPGHPPLTAAELDLLRRWIELGAPYAPHWAWNPASPTAAPPVDDATWPRDDVDRFILARLESRSLRPAPDADRATWLRRVTVDLTGLPPEPEAILAFLADDAPDARERAVDALLASPAFGERWGRHWLDVMRYAESYGHEFDYTIPMAWRYRDAIIDAFNADLPYDRLMAEHIAGDTPGMTRRAGPDGLDHARIATGWWHFAQGTHAPVDVRHDAAERVDNQIDVLSKAFLATTIACARCHDHKFDPVPTTSYYGLAGVLRSSRRAVGYLDPHGRIASATLALDELQASRQRDGDDPVARSLLLDALAALQADPARAERAAGPAAGASPAWIEGQEWTTDGAAFVTGSAAPSGTVRVTPDGVVISRGGPGDSALRAESFAGSLRSASFVAPSEPLHALVRGSGRVRVIIDGYHLDEENALLFEGFIHDVDTDGAARWLRWDLRRYAGHQTYLEAHDNGAGTLAIEAVAIGAEPPAIQAPEPSVLDADLRAALEDPASRWPLAASRLVAALVEDGTLTPDDHGVADARRAAARIAGDAPAPPRALVMLEGTPEDERVFVRGDHRSPGELVRRGAPSLYGGAVAEAASSGRAELAATLVGPARSQAMRVMANRVWHHLFGRGIVPTVDDFGALGQVPTHPGLLDHLAAALSDDPSIKRLVRRLVLSRAYAMSSVHPDPDVGTIDADNALLHRFRVRRLDAESLRDTMLALAGRLDPTMGGPPVPVHLTEFMQGRGRPAESGPVDGGGRRSVYLSVRRNFLAPFMLTFDFPAPASTVGRRNDSNVPAQSLTLMNDPFVHSMAASWASRLLAPTPAATRHDDSDHGRVTRALLAAYGRPPDAAEVELAVRMLDRERAVAATGDSDRELAAWTALCHAVFNTREFSYLP